MMTHHSDTRLEPRVIRKVQGGRLFSGKEEETTKDNGGGTRIRIHKCRCYQYCFHLSMLMMKNEIPDEFVELREKGKGKNVEKTRISPIPSPTRSPRNLSTLGPTITLVEDEATTTSVGVETEGAATTTSGLDAGMDSGNIHKSPLRSHEAPLSDGNTSRSVEDSLQLKELMAIVPKMKVKFLEVALKRMSKRVILSDSEDEETKNRGRKIQDIDDDPLVSLVRESMKEKEADFVSI
ncbi:hypothetical protein Tco_0618535 [Tanacetum coccineum]